jgi:hypothetical protein
MKATAVAYLGFAGNILSFEVDLPLALCEDTLLFEDGNYNCTIGRMINSGSQTGTNDTARWTDFTDTEQCTDQSGINTTTMVDVVKGPSNDCNGGNPTEIPFGSVLATGNGENAPVMAEIKDCFQDLYYDDANGTYDMWSAKLPVVDCMNPKYNTNCSPAIGVAGVYIAWVNDKQDMKYVNVPKFMYGPKDDEGNIITDEYDDPIFPNWPGDSPGLYDNVLKEDLEPFIADLWTYYESNQQNDYKDLAQELADIYPSGWTVADLFIDQGLDIIDPNGVVLRNEDEIDGKARWASFIQHFQLNNVDADEYTGELITKPAPWNKCAVYFLPSCKVDVQTGGTGGKNFGILAKIPVLVD